MNRQQAKDLLPIIQAFAEGKTIQQAGRRGWFDVDSINFDLCKYRIKPEPKYRPFANAEECWQEMQKHHPFGWIKKTCGDCNFLHIMELYSTGILINKVDSFGSFRNLIKTYDSAFAETIFADGTPFGIKEE
ncbi:hypothetical protein [Prevotella sp.]|uniref:hypothetical protein n=1 Tax=Prevotella sp. TaxID=59823 RepID=UPI0030784D22